LRKIEAEQQSLQDKIGIFQEALVILNKKTSAPSPSETSWDGLLEDAKNGDQASLVVARYGLKDIN
jgi:hypothetical protein